MMMRFVLNIISYKERLSLQVYLYFKNVIVYNNIIRNDEKSFKYLLSIINIICFLLQQNNYQHSYRGKVVIFFLLTFISISILSKCMNTLKFEYL